MQGFGRCRAGEEIAGSLVAELEGSAELTGHKKLLCEAAENPEGHLVFDLIPE